MLKSPVLRPLCNTPDPGSSITSKLTPHHWHHCNPEGRHDMIPRMVPGTMDQLLPSNRYLVAVNRSKSPPLTYRLVFEVISLFCLVGVQSAFLTHASKLLNFFFTYCTSKSFHPHVSVDVVSVAFSTVRHSAIPHRAVSSSVFFAFSQSRQACSSELQLCS